MRMISRFRVPIVRAMAAMIATMLVASASFAGDVRELDLTPIEGEIPGPEVLFITVRDQPRFDDRLHLSFEPSAAALDSLLQPTVGIAVPPPATLTPIDWRP